MASSVSAWIAASKAVVPEILELFNICAPPEELKSVSVAFAILLVSLALSESNVIAIIKEDTNENN